MTLQRRSRRDGRHQPQRGVGRAQRRASAGSPQTHLQPDPSRTRTDSGYERGQTGQGHSPRWRRPPGSRCVPVPQLGTQLSAWGPIKATRTSLPRMARRTSKLRCVSQHIGPELRGAGRNSRDCRRACRRLPLYRTSRRGPNCQCQFAAPQLLCSLLSALPAGRLLPSDKGSQGRPTTASWCRMRRPTVRSPSRRDLVSRAGARHRRVISCAAPCSMPGPAACGRVTRRLPFDKGRRFRDSAARDDRVSVVILT